MTEAIMFLHDLHDGQFAGVHVETIVHALDWRKQEINELHNKLATMQRQLDDCEAKLTRGVRRTDPSTSLKGWEFSEATRLTARGVAFQIFVDNPHREFSAEDVYMMTNRDGIWKRVSELHQLGKIVHVGEKASSKGTTVRKYRLAERS